MQPNSKFNLPQLMKSDPATRLQRYVQLTEKHRDSQSWREIALHILSKEDFANQYTILKQVLSRMKNGDRKLFARIAPKIDRQFSNCHTMGGVFVLSKYILAIQNKDCDYFAEKGFKEGLRRFGLFEKEIENIQGITHLDNENLLLSEIQSGVEVIPRLYQKLKMPFDMGMLKPFLMWLTLYRCKNYEYCVILDEFCKFIVISCANANRLIAGYDIQGTATLIMQVLNKCLVNYPNSHNLCMIFENMSQLQVQTAVVRFQKMFSQLSSADMVKFSNVLTRSSLGNKTVRLFLALSIVMKNSRMNDKLVDYFKNFIIPKILLWGKMSSTAEPEIRNLVDFYVNGLLDRTPNKQQCISSILTDFNRLGGQSQEYWTNIMYKIAYNETSLISKINRQCKGIANPLRKQQFDKLQLKSWRIIVNLNMNSSSSSYLNSSLQQHLPPTNVEYNKQQQSSLKPPIRPSYQQSPVTDKRKLEESKNSSQQNISQPYVSKLSGSSSIGLSSSQIISKQSNLLTPQQNKYGFQTSSFEGFSSQSSLDKRQMTQSNDNKFYKTDTKFNSTSGSLINSRIEPAVKRTKEPKVTPTKVSTIPSKSAGYNTNYADMSVMLLFALQKFPNLLASMKDQIMQNIGKFPVLNELNSIFQKMSKYQGKQVNMTNLMRLGPQEYVGKDKQFEIIQYSSKLFNSIVNDLQRVAGRYNATQKFKQLFQIVIKKQAICPKCQNQTQQFLNTYFLPVLSHEPLRTEWESQKQLNCQKCRALSQNVMFKNKLISSPSLTMVQLINQNKRRQPLPRRWNNSNLVALVIVNSSSSLSVGQYRFYCRNMKSPLVWNQFTANYHQTLEFTNEQQDDEFEAKFMPYIAIYQQIE